MIHGLENRGQGGEEQGGHAPEFFAVGDRELAEHALALGRDLDQDFAMVPGVPVPAHQAEGGEAVEEADDRVVPELELPGQRADGGKAVRRDALDRQEELVLLGFQARPAGLPLAEGEEAADQMTEMGEALVVGLVQPRSGRRHDPQIISYYDIKSRGIRGSALSQINPVTRIVLPV